MWNTGRRLLRLLVLLAVSCVVSGVQTFSASPSFTIDYERDTFLLDGQPFRFVSGSIHYFRVPRAYWPDRLRRLRSMGANAVQIYVEWNSHEREQEQYNFEGDYDLVEFISEAQRQGLLVLLRTGPFIDAERDMGGLPYWLLSVNPQMKLRSSDKDFLRLLDRWFDQLLPKLKPLTYARGGPIIMVQVENEYGSYGACDGDYMQHVLHKLQQGLGNETLFYTTDGDGAGYLKCGATEGAYATVDFGPGADVTEAFAAQRTKSPHGPLVNSEYYPGWLDHWGYPHSTRSTSSVVKTFEEMLEAGANVNFYMAHGGTSFGWGAGSNGGESDFKACPTSYDYDAQIAENGFLTDKFFALRNVTLRYLPDPSVPDPPPQPRAEAYGYVYMKSGNKLFSILKSIDGEPITSNAPMTFEELQSGYGFVLYSHVISDVFPDPALLDLTGVRDRGYIFVDGTMAGIVSREEKIFTLPVSVTNGSTLEIMVENRGRICFGNYINDIKGLTAVPTLDSKPLSGWKHTPIPLNFTQIQAIQHAVQAQPLSANQQLSGLPVMFHGTFELPDNVTSYADTFLRLDGWRRGVAFINGFHLGRYWPTQGPQVTLYVPGTLLLPHNHIMVLELEETPCNDTGMCRVSLTDTHVIDGPTPHK